MKIFFKRLCISLVILYSQHPSERWVINLGTLEYCSKQMFWEEINWHIWVCVGGTFLSSSTLPHISKHLFQASVFCSMNVKLPNNNFILYVRIPGVPAPINIPLLTKHGNHLRGTKPWDIFYLFNLYVSLTFPFHGCTWNI